VDTAEATEGGDIGEAMAIAPIEHEAGECISSSLMYRRLTFFFQRARTGILKLIRNVDGFICVSVFHLHYITIFSCVKDSSMHIYTF